MKANQIVLDQITNWKGLLISVFDSSGLGMASFGGFFLAINPTFSYRLAQVKAGIGVYGRPGVCITPSFRCYYHVGVPLTEAELTSTKRQYPKGFNPCEECSECEKVCPVRAIDVSKQPGAGYDREKCARFILRMKKRHGNEAKICSRCFTVCPWSMGRKNGI
ncbi:MAG: 4Fe-4S double cluster binding domain-containing protein [Promethearchaeota archaeon]